MVKIGEVIDNDVCEDGKHHEFGFVDYKLSLLGCRRCMVVGHYGVEEKESGELVFEKHENGPMVGQLVLVRVDGKKWGGE